MPAPARGLQLLGRFERSGHRDAPSLVRRSDGQIIQLTPVLYAVLESIDGRRSFDDVAAVVAERTGKLATEADVRFLTEEKLRPLGLLQTADGSDPVARKADPLLGLRLRMIVSNPDITRRIAAPFAKLFVPPLVLAVSVAFLLLTGWLLFDRGLAPAVREALYSPGLLLLVFALTTLSAGFHELGHAAACLYGGGRPGAMGAALYLVWPAFYTDVTDAYRLDRRARLRVDLGGIYFNAIFALGAFALWAATGWETVLAIVPLQALQMVRQLVPLVRLDGYHILADLTGVPDLFAHIKSILLGMLPTRWGRAENKVLKPWVRVVVSTWVIVVVPVLVLMLVAIVLVLPRIAATAWDSIGLRSSDVASAWEERDPAATAMHFLSIVAIAIPVLSMCYLVLRVLRRIVLRVWRVTAGRPARRAVAVAVAVGLLAGLVSAWWPDGQYRPIAPDERGRLADVGIGMPPLIDQALTSDSFEAAPMVTPGRLVVYGDARATIVDASAGTAAPVEGPEREGGFGSTFRFGTPPPPGEGDNQALAVNYVNGSSVIDMALSLVFAGEGVVDNTNEAYALASCMKCLAAAIAFQLVVILDEADAVVPENTAAAISAYCIRCVTYALAFQVIVSVSEPLSDEATNELDRIWSRLEALEENLENMSLEELQISLMEIEAEIMELLADEGELTLSEDAALDEDSESAVDDPSPLPTGEPSPSSEPSRSPESSPTPESSPAPESSPSPDSSPGPESSPSSSSEP